MYLRWQSRLNSYQAFFRLFLVSLYFSTGIAQLIWSRRRPGSYIKARYYLVLFQRLSRLLAFSTVPFTARTLLKRYQAASNMMGTLEGSSKLLRLPDWAVAIKLISICSGGAYGFVHALNHPLPFWSTVFVQLAYLLIQLLYALAPAMHLLGPQEHRFRCICDLMNFTAEFALFSTSGSHILVPDLIDRCNTHSLSMLLLFAAVYLSFCVPAYICYCLEVRTKRQFLLTLRQGRQPGAGGLWDASDPPWWAPRFQDLCNLMLIAVTTWILVLMLHDRLLALAYPL